MIRPAKNLVFLVLALSAAGFAQASHDPRLTVLDSIINDAISQGQIPGAVVVIGHNGKVIHRKAYGERSLKPRREAMTLSTVFDCASLTKVVVTTTAVMQLWDCLLYTSDAADE